MSEWKTYIKTVPIEARPWKPEDGAEGFKVNPTDKLNGHPMLGDLLGRDPLNTTDVWLICRYYVGNYMLLPDDAAERLAQKVRPTKETEDRFGSSRRTMEPLDIVPSPELKRRFSAHETSNEQGAVMARVRSHAASFAALIEHVTPPGRERAEAVKLVETAMFWANAGIARPASAHGRKLTMETPSAIP